MMMRDMGMMCLCLCVSIGPEDGNDRLEGIVKGGVVGLHGQLEGILDAFGLLVVDRLFRGDGGERG